MTKIYDYHDHGRFEITPQAVIPTTMGGDVFGSVSNDNSLFTGTQGSVTYAGDGFLLTVHWDNPFVGVTSSSTEITGETAWKYRASSVTGGGNQNAHMIYDLFPNVVDFSTVEGKYTSLGGSSSFLRQPVEDVKGSPDGLGRYRHYQGGSIYWSPSSGAHEVHGAVKDKWASMGWERYDYPITDESVTPDGVGRYNHFQFMHPDGPWLGSIYWTPQTGAHAVYGAIRLKWASLGWERSHLGYPVTDEVDDVEVHGGRISEFQGGSIAWNPASGAYEIGLRVIINVSPSSIEFGQPTQVIVKAVDSVTNAPIAGTISIDGFGSWPTNTAFDYTFQRPRGRRVFDSISRRWNIEEGEPPEGKLVAAGYPDQLITFDFIS